MPLHAHDLRPPPGSKRPRKRVGRGNASGTGTYSGRGLKGQKSRAGGSLRIGFEGGQVPLFRRMPRKRGFRSPFRVEYTAVNLFKLNERFEPNAEVTAETLAAAGLLRNTREPFKVLARGELDRPLTVRVAKISGSARTKIEAAGGQVEVLNATRATSAESL